MRTYSFARFIVQNDALEGDDAVRAAVARAVDCAVRALADAIELFKLLDVAARADRLKVPLRLARSPHALQRCSHFVLGSWSARTSKSSVVGVTHVQYVSHMHFMYKLCTGRPKTELQPLRGFI